MITLTEDELNLAFASEDSELQRMIHALVTHPYYNFVPRPDAPQDYDEQTAFVGSDAKFSICLGGTGSGKTVAGCYKTAKYVLETPPPRPRCPFWVIGETYEMACGVCWNEKLVHFIPPEQIAAISYISRQRNWPAAVLLAHPTIPDEIGWVIEFKSYAQGRERMQAASIGGYWFNEEVPLSIVEEVHGRCRDYDSPGWADFTPIEMKSPDWLLRYADPPVGWRFFHLNSEKNTALPEGFIERYLSTVPEDMRDTRRIGVFSSFRGQVFKEWRPQIHIIDPFEIPADWRKFRGLDFGFNNPFCCLWIARDHDGRYYVYDEHYLAGQVLSHHAAKIHSRHWDTSNPHFGKTYSDHDAQQRAELARHEIVCTPARKDINAGIERLRSLMMPQPDGRPKFYVMRNCPNLIREIPAYKWPDVMGREGSYRNAKEAPVDFDNHAIDACRYVIYSEESSLAASELKHYRVTRANRSFYYATAKERESGRRRGDNGENGYSLRR